MGNNIGVSILPRSAVERIVKFFNDNPSRDDCNIGVEGGMLIAKRSDLLKFIEALNRGTMHEENPN